jgi:flagellar hook-associated protein 3 FlgL
MVRVSDGSVLSNINFSINKNKEKLEELQLKGSTLKKVIRPSDNPSGTAELMQIKTNNLISDQFKKNAIIATTNLEITENALSDLGEVLNKAKELAVAQSSDLYNPEVRLSVSKEVRQLLEQTLGISNRRNGSRYLFSGYKTLDRPFDHEGKYNGDNGITKIEISKDFFVPINLPGHKIFYNQNSSEVNREENNEDKNKVSNAQNSIFQMLSSLEQGLKTSNTEVIQNLLNEFDTYIDQVITLRASVGSSINTINSVLRTVDEELITNTTRRSKIEDADVAELFSDLRRQGHILEASYRSNSNMLNDGLIKFLK